MATFKLGDSVSLTGRKGMIVNIHQPLGTYPLFTVQYYDNGTLRDYAKHELVLKADETDVTLRRKTGYLNDSVLPETYEKDVHDFLFDDWEPESEMTTTTEMDNITESVKNSSSIDKQFTTTCSLSEPNSEEDFLIQQPKCHSSNTCNSKAKKQNTENVADLKTQSKCKTSAKSKTTGVEVNTKPKQLSRFQTDVNDKFVEDYIAENENMNTKRKTQGHLNILNEFLHHINETREIQNIPPCELNSLLSKFFLCVRRKDGNEYEPSSLRGILGSLERHLKTKEYGQSVMSGVNFAKTRAAVKSKQKNLKGQGLGNKPKTADPVTDTEIDHLYESNVMGCETPNSLLNTLWFNNTLHFGIRGGAEAHRHICWGDVALQYDSELQLDYLEHNERQTKTRTGADIRNIRSEKPRMYEQKGNERCPVKTYLFYTSKRPSNFSQPEHPFYLATVTNVSQPRNNEQWFMRGPVGQKKLGSLMKSMAQKANLPELENKRITNTSVRKYLCQKLMERNVPDTHAVHITGHKNPNSLNNYRVMNNKQKFAVSTMLSNTNNSIRPNNYAIENDQPTEYNHNNYINYPSCPSMLGYSFGNGTDLQQYRPPALHQGPHHPDHADTEFIQSRPRAVLPSCGPQSELPPSDFTESVMHDDAGPPQSTNPPQCAHSHQSLAVRLQSTELSECSVKSQFTCSNNSKKASSSMMSLSESRVNMPWKSNNNPSQTSASGNIFGGAFIHGGNFTVNMNYQAPAVVSSPPQRKRRRIIISDSDTD